MADVRPASVVPVTAATITGQVSVKSGNGKTGPIPTTSRSLATCPQSCPFRPDGALGGCYGTGRIFGMADKFTREHDTADLIAAMGKIPQTRKMIIRDRVVGDLDDGSGGVDVEWMRAVAGIGEAVGRRVFGYTHHRDVTAADVPDGYTLNASCETEADVREAWSRGLPAVMAGPLDDMPDTIGDARVVRCPATTRDDTTCATCGLCAGAGRMTDPAASAVVYFPLHGTAVRKATAAVAARKGE